MKPMLATNYDPALIDLPIALQPKLDGMRILWDGINPKTRNNHTSVSCPELYKVLREYFDHFPLDGELWHNKGFENLISSVKRAVNIEEDPDVCFYVFDQPHIVGDFKTRWERTVEKVNSVNHPRIKLVETTFHTTLPDPLNIYDGIYEGTMIRNCRGLYVPFRSKNLLKLKAMQEMEVHIVGVLEGEGRLKGSLGALVGQTKDMLQVGIGTGFSDDQRVKFWREPPIGKVATIQYQELMKSGVPRFSVFKGFRDYE